MGVACSPRYKPFIIMGGWGSGKVEKKMEAAVIANKREVPNLREKKDREVGKRKKSKAPKSDVRTGRERTTTPPPTKMGATLVRNKNVRSKRLPDTPPPQWLMFYPYEMVERVDEFEKGASTKGSTINDLGGAEEKSKMNSFFPRQCLLKFIFSRRMPLEIYFFLGKAS